MANLVLYNTLMGLAASIALLLLVLFPHYGARAPVDVRRAWAWTFGGLGGILVIMGLHVNFVWPLLGVANIVFGEPSLLFGVLLVIAAVIIYRTPVSNDDESIESVEEAETSWRRVWAGADLPLELAVALRPVGYVGGGAGVMVILLGWATAAFGTIVFRAPPNEWPTGLVAGTGLEVAYMTATYTILGLGAILVPVGLHDPARLKTAGRLLAIAGLLLLFITLVSFVGHVSLAAGAQPGGIPWPPG